MQLHPVLLGVYWDREVPIVINRFQLLAVEHSSRGCAGLGRYLLLLREAPAVLYMRLPVEWLGVAESRSDVELCSILRAWFAEARDTDWAGRASARLAHRSVCSTRLQAWQPYVAFHGALVSWSSGENMLRQSYLHGSLNTTTVLDWSVDYLPCATAVVRSFGKMLPPAWWNSVWQVSAFPTYACGECGWKLYCEGGCSESGVAR
jgi:radical SAM protein with 4Fe4S-binding SPASM domain